MRRLYFPTNLKWCRSASRDRDRILRDAALTTAKMDPAILAAIFLALGSVGFVVYSSGTRKDGSNVRPYTGPGGGSPGRAPVNLRPQINALPARRPKILSRRSDADSDSSDSDDAVSPYSPRRRPLRSPLDTSSSLC